MTPINGKFIFLGSINVPTSLGNVTISAAEKGGTEIVVTAATGLNTIRSSPFLFLAGSTSTYAYGTRIVDTKSPKIYNVTSMSWATNVLTLNHDAIPVACIATQKVYITGSSNTAVVPNGTYSVVGAGSSTTVTTVTLNGTSLVVTGTTSKVQPGIIETDGDNRGYYTINCPTLGVVTATATAVYTPQINPYSGQTFATVVGATPAAIFGYVSFDSGGGRAAIPQGMPICVDQLQFGKYFTATAASNDASVISFFKPAMLSN